MKNRGQLEFFLLPNTHTHTHDILTFPKPTLLLEMTRFLNVIVPIVLLIISCISWKYNQNFKSEHGSQLVFNYQKRGKEKWVLNNDAWWLAEKHHTIFLANQR